MMKSAPAPKQILFGESFHPKMILEGEKNTTIRLTIRDIKEGDTLSLCDMEQREFARAVVTSVKVITMGQLTKEDMEGHEKYASQEEMYKTFEKYYHRPVGPDTQVQVLKFRLV